MNANSNKNEENEIHHALEAFSRSLIPSLEDTEKSTAAVQKIFEVLKEKGEKVALSIDRVFISGRVGGKTAISNSNFDFVVYVNIDNVSEIEGVLDKFERIITSSGLCVRSCKRHRYSYQFKYQWIDFNVFPAINLLDHQMAEQVQVEMGDRERAAETAFKVYEQLFKNPNLRDHYSSALIETSLRFLDEQGQDESETSFIHDLVRLGQKLYKMAIFQPFVSPYKQSSGRSTLMEVISVYAAQEELKRAKEETRSHSLLEGFKGFLNLVVSMPGVHIKFDDFDPLSPQRLSKAISWLQPESSPFLKQTMAHAYIMDPANPFNNLYKALKYWERKKFQVGASTCLERLNDCVRNWPSVSMDTVFDPFELTRRENERQSARRRSHEHKVFLSNLVKF